MEENKKIDWISRLMLALGLLLLVVVGWYGVALTKSIVYLRLHMDQFNSSLADASTILYEYNVSDAGAVATVSPGVFLGRIGCLLIWNGWSIGCYSPAENVDVLIYFKDEWSEANMRRIDDMVRGGWVEKSSLLATNEQSIDAYVSDPDEIGFWELMRIVRFGDIVGTSINIETNKVEKIVMMYKGGVLW